MPLSQQDIKGKVKRAVTAWSVTLCGACPICVSTAAKPWGVATEQRCSVHSCWKLCCTVVCRRDRAATTKIIPNLSLKKTNKNPKSTAMPRPTYIAMHECRQTPTSAACATTFNGNSKQKVKQWYFFNCWHCACLWPPFIAKAHYSHLQCIAMHTARRRSM